MVNLFGLILSLTAFSFILIYVGQELSYDKGHPNYERIHRVTEIIQSENYTENSSSSPYNTGEVLLQEYPDNIEVMTRFFDFQVPVVSIELEDQRQFVEKKIYFADSTVFDILDFELTSGNPKEALTRPHTALLSEDLAEKYFPGQNPIGQTFKYEGKMASFEITGTYKQNSVSHIKTKMLLSMSSVNKIAPFVKQNWVWNPCWTYIRLKENVSPYDFETIQLPAFVDKYYPERVKGLTTHQLQPITDIHLKSNLEFEISANGDLKHLYIFISCAIFLLCIATVNFINLTTASSVLRARDTAVKVVFGSTRKELVIQFLIESILVTLIAWGISCIALLLLSPLVSSIIGTHFDWQIIFHFPYFPILLSAILMMAVVSALYPAIYLSKINPISAFKGSFLSLSQGQLLRKLLVTGQFTIAIILIVFTWTAFKQLGYLQERDPGFSSDKVILLRSARSPIPWVLDPFKSELKSSPLIESVTIMNEIIGLNNNNHEFHHEGVPQGQWNYYPALMIDEDFIPTFKIDLIAGRNYLKENQREDSLSIIINRTLSKTLGFENPEDAIGTRLHSLSGKEKIIGVVEDFNYKSFHSPMGSLVLDIEHKKGNFFYFAKNVAIRVSEVNPESIAHIENTWNKFVPDKPFHYKILKTELDKIYQDDLILSRVLALFTILTIFIACLGLFGLTYFIAQRKTKEVSIRKVLGASFSQLFLVGYKEQFQLIVIAIVLSIPLGMVLIQNWLNGFAFHINIGATPFLVASLIAFAISALTVLVVFQQVIRKDPANVLKYE